MALQRAGRTSTRALGVLGLRSAGKTGLLQLMAGLRPTPLAPTFSVERRDVRLHNEWLARLAVCYPGARVVPATCQAIDVGGVDPDASPAADEKSFASRVFAELRTADALVHVVDCYSSTSDSAGGPADAALSVEWALVQCDLASAERAAVKRKAKLSAADSAALDLCIAELRAGRRLANSAAARAPHVAPVLASLQALSSLPLLLVGNVGSDFGEGESRSRRCFDALAAHAAASGERALAVAVDFERDVCLLGSAAEAAELRALARLPAGQLDALALAVGEILQLSSFLTAGPAEVRAWPMPRGGTARACAAAVHSSFTQRFIRVHVATAADVVAAGSLAACAKVGRVRVESGEYVLRSDDVCDFQVRSAS